MNHGSLFSGIGGFDLAAEWMGWENKFHCEWNDFGKRVLKYYWPKAITYDDITKTDFTIHRGNIDILTGGFPCQPYSAAGKRLGKEDDRHLWPEMLRAIREIQPKWIVGENVLGLVNWNGGLVFDEVQANLEAEGYNVQPYVLPAVSVNAPHRRDRVWFVAYRNSAGFQAEGAKQQTAGIKQYGELGRDATNSKSNGNRRGLRPMESENGSIGKSEEYRENNNQPRNNGQKWNVTDSNSEQRCERRMHQTESETAERYVGASNARCHKRESWENFPTQSPVCNGNDGFSSQLDGITFPKWRNESIKAGGNAIVPQVAFQIFKAIDKYENR